MKIDRIEIFAGVGKDGSSETFDKLELDGKNTISIVGPTGSGKTAFINDIEIGANYDTNTKRRVSIKFLEQEPGGYVGNPCVLITQNTKCFTDLKVKEFLEIHAKSRNDSSEDVIEKCIEKANLFTGEGISPEMDVTTLSGGQTRALLIADAIVIGEAPILILDEIENAGIYKDVVVKEIRDSGKMVIFVTHDATIALQTDYRIVMREGKIEKIIKRNEEERELSEHLQKYDAMMNRIRDIIRYGNPIDMSVLEYAKN